MATDVGRGFTDDFLKETANDLLSEATSIFGLPSRQKISGTLSEDEVLDLTVFKAQQEERIAEAPKSRLEPAFRPLQENLTIHQEEMALKQEIEIIRTEIRKEVNRLDDATKNLEKETARITVEEVPSNPGIYHRNFFEWILGLLKNIRQKVEDAGSWLSLTYSRRNQKKYWNRFKKHGTSFGLSGERVVATQTG